MIFGVAMLTGCNQQTTQPIADVLSSEVKANEKVVWETYQNNEYGFRFDYPWTLFVRDGIKDYKPAGLLNFYQLCGEIITTPQEPSLGANDNFVGYCKDEFFKIEIWKAATETSQIQTDFSTLTLTETNAITIADTPAIEYVYEWESNAIGWTHTRYLYVVKGNEFIYAMRGDHCMDTSIVECRKIISTVKFTKASH